MTDLPDGAERPVTIDLPEDRPPRWLTLGRRRSDRVAFYALVLVSLICCAYVVRTSYRMDEMQAQLDRTVQECRRLP